ncbi:hypothetical protein POF50_011625 [Streptomyces sp. SL13]|uniref:carbonic anhydrase n=1 Tax=Streptantibioticus silvisoli TaxID=2705255 RepID=A0AA90H3B9_9ACTN|nr:carbonic anhydrase [Streptantibioticus silvisoli]MDI5969979.1 hypothetical protein [Streptantibioticus silvisoli]
MPISTTEGGADVRNRRIPGRQPDVHRRISGPLPLSPSRRVAVLACGDARIDVHALLGLNEGEAQVIRNAGGVVTNETIRSPVISRRLPGTREIVLIHPTDCGMATFTDDDVAQRISAGTGIRLS